MHQEAAEQCIDGAKRAMAEGDWDKALRLLDKSIRLNPTNSVRPTRAACSINSAQPLFSPPPLPPPGWTARLVPAPLGLAG